MAGRPLPAIPWVEKVDVQDEHVRWTTGSREEHLSVNDIILIVEQKRANSDHSFLIAGLKEPGDQSGELFELVLARAASIPDALLQQHLIDHLPSHLQAKTDNLVDIIVSTRSGTGLSQKFYDIVLGPLWTIVSQDLGGYAANVLVTQTAETVTEYAHKLKSALDSPPAGGPIIRTVILLSGDGGVVDLLNGFDEASSSQPHPIIALLPLGTGNALFHSLHKPTYTELGPTPLVTGLRTLLRGSVADLPVFRASFSAGSETVEPAAEVTSGTEVDDDKPAFIARPVSYLNGAIVASYGFHASLVYESDTPAYRVHGSQRFGIVAQELLKEAHPYTARVELRRPGFEEFDTVPRDAHAYVLSTMVSNLERAFTISPASRPLDGKLRLVHFGPLGGEQIMKLMQAAYQDGKHVDEVWGDGERIGYDEFEELRVTVTEENDRWRKVCIDGTIVGLPKDGTMTVNRLKNGPFRIQVDSRILES